jgi:hypothetical protein
MSRMDAVLTELRKQWLVLAIMGSVIAWVAVLVTSYRRSLFHFSYPIHSSERHISVARAERRCAALPRCTYLFLAWQVLDDSLVVLLPAHRAQGTP